MEGSEPPVLHDLADVCARRRLCPIALLFEVAHIGQDACPQHPAASTASDSAEPARHQGRLAQEKSSDGRRAGARLVEEGYECHLVNSKFDCRCVHAPTVRKCLASDSTTRASDFRGGMSV